MQLVGTWSSRDGTWLWGDRNPSVSRRGYEALFAILDPIEALRPLRAQPRFEIDKQDALALATWCARKAAFAAAWPGDTGDSIAMLAVDPIAWPGSPNETRGRQWCTFCGKTRREVKALVAGPGVMVCNECVQLLRDIAAERTRDQPDVPTMPPCVFCAGRTPRVFTPYAAMCLSCIDLATGALQPS